ncbi:MAG TPA: PilZ domain-containing protein [Terriglobales bacterium]
MADNAQHDPERRRYPRIKVKISIELLRTGAPLTRTAIEDVSLCGCYMETMFTMEVGTTLNLILWLNEERLHAKGVVATKYPQVGNGIDFVEISREDRLKLAAFIGSSGPNENT